MHCNLRPARAADAAAICEVLRRSIIELCLADHHGDPDILSRWLMSKTTENIRGWIANQNNHIFVADDDGTIAAVGALNASAEITLNYVSPDYQFRGLSKAMLHRLEAMARALGFAAVHLTSTATAYRLYLSAGYVDQGSPENGFFTATSRRMRKSVRTDYPASK